MGHIDAMGAAPSTANESTCKSELIEIGMNKWKKWKPNEKWKESKDSKNIERRKTIKWKAIA